jgi:hypothetical protein
MSTRPSSARPHRLQLELAPAQRVSHLPLRPLSDAGDKDDVTISDGGPASVDQLSRNREQLIWNGEAERFSGCEIND